MNIVIISGGVGSRLWPVSRENNPKPFIKMEDGLSLLQKTFLRGTQVSNRIDSVMTVTNSELFFRTEDEYRELSPSMPLHYLLEPFGRNTAPAICSAAIELQVLYGDNALMLVLPADHIIRDQEAFRRAVDLAAETAARGQLVTLGVQPTHAETGFGYIEVSKDEEISSSRVLDVIRFVEKPNRELAEQYLLGGDHLWNTGMFCCRVGTLIEELKIYTPDLIRYVTTALEVANRSEGAGHTITRLLAESFNRVEDESIDYALMEKSDKVAVVACDLGWSDVGSWEAMANLIDSDEAGNRVVGEVELESSRNIYVRSPHRLTAVVGVDDLVIVDTADALLVAHKSRSQDIKSIALRLKQKTGGLHKNHVTVHRPWGTYTVLEEGVGFKIKRIEVKPEASLSLQVHYHRSEHWIVVRGTAKVIKGEEEFLLPTNVSTYIPAGYKHRLENPGLIPLVVIEVQSGECLDEDDIVRFSDSYGRC